jgi:hypothetical protein
MILGERMNVIAYVRKTRSLAGLVAATVFLITRPGLAETPQQTRGFLITKFHPAIYAGDFAQDCPQGFEVSTRDGYVATLTPAERERLLKPENAQEFNQKWRVDHTSGPYGEDICANPKSFLKDASHPPFRTSNSKIAEGLNLDGTRDGKATANSCAHRKLIGPNGEPGIDNQASRALGCSALWRGSDGFGDQLGFREQYMKDGVHNILMEIKGITDLRNDDVEVSIYSAASKPLLDANVHYIANQTMTVTSNNRWRNSVHGKILNGVLTTDSIEVLRLDEVSPLGGGQGLGFGREFALRKAKLRLLINDDGSVKGLLAAYDDFDDISSNSLDGGKGAATETGLDCASQYNTLVALADGFPDPKTGQCTMISTAFQFEAIPAFLINARPVTASATGATP